MFIQMQMWFVHVRVCVYVIINLHLYEKKKMILEVNNKFKIKWSKIMYLNIYTHTYVVLIIYEKMQPETVALLISIWI